LKTKAPNTTGSNHLYNTLELLMMDTIVPETRWASIKICNKNHLLHLLGILFPHTNDDARKKPHQICCLLLQNSGVICGTRDSVVQPCTRSDRVSISVRYEGDFFSVVGTLKENVVMTVII